MENIIKKLAGMKGNYYGIGTNHEGEEFSGELSLNGILNDKAIEIRFKATSKDGAVVFHDERSTIALSQNEKPHLWNLNSNTPYLLEHELKRCAKIDEQAELYVFGFNDVNNKNQFREEIHLEVYQNGDIGYRYFWGMPGGDFAYRSGLAMRKD